MHIPDGYLSPSTCAALYAAALPFWSAALRRLRDVFSARLVPLIALSGAFSFVIMMFNLPLPGGTTGHATGVAIAAITLGPWGAIISISVALAIQALFFGDGGILALGANCFNIAIVGGLTAHVVYRLLAMRSATGSRRRVFAAGAAGYLAVNAAALVTAVQLGLQPLLFHDAAGAPLYAPYPLHIAIPAMMLGHLTIAGVAEAMLTGGVVAYLQRAKPSLLSAPLQQAAARPYSPWRTLRPLWIAVALMMVLSPLGLIASGTAWGEWSPSDLAHAESRLAIARSSLDAPLPAAVPSGLSRWSEMWSAPVAGYATPFLRSESGGYVLSAIFGVGSILGLALLFDAFLSRKRKRHAALP